MVDVNSEKADITIIIKKHLEYSDNYYKTYGSLWQYHIDDPNDALTNSESFKSKIKITGKTSADGNTKGVKIAVPLKY